MLVFQFGWYKTLFLAHFAYLTLWGGEEGTGCSDHKMPAVAYGVMFLANEDLYAGTPLVGFIIILDPVNGTFGQKK